MGKVIAQIDEVFLETSSEKKHQIPLDVFPLEIQSIVYDYNKYLKHLVKKRIKTLKNKPKKSRKTKQKRE